MRIAILGTGTSNHHKLDPFTEIKLKPSFRKASLNMKMGYQSIREACRNFSHLDECGFVLGTSYGEIENTKEFLKNFATTGVARPILFQSSLHNGTLGFLALELSIFGPTFTVSQHHFTGEHALSLGIDLIRGGLVPACLVTTVDIMSPALLSILERMYPPHLKWKDGAASFIISTETKAKEWGIKPLAFLDSVECMPDAKIPPEVNIGEFNDSNALELLSRVIQEKLGELILQKPDRSFSRITWSHVTT